MITVALSTGLPENDLSPNGSKAESQPSEMTFAPPTPR